MSLAQILLGGVVWALCIMRTAVFVRRDELLVQQMKQCGMKANYMAGWFQIAIMFFGPVTLLMGILLTPARRQLRRNVALQLRQQHTQDVPRLSVVPAA